jgi:TonB family protein
MSRLQRKCLFTSAALHALLVLILVLTAAFLDRQPDRFDLPLLEVIPSTLVDAQLYGGGKPEAQPAPPPPREVPAPAPTPAPQPVPRQPKPEPRVEPEPPPKKKPEVKTAETKPVKPKQGIAVQSETKRVTPAKSPDETAEARRKAEELRKKFESASSRLSNQLTPRTTIDVPGPGGEAYANYRQALISIYQQAWIKPEGVENAAVVKATITIARNGRVLSARVTRLSGNRTVDDSVEQVLQRVKEVRPFPQGAKDETRSFDLSFELTPADLTG